MGKRILLVQFRTDVSLAHEVECVCSKLETKDVITLNPFVDEIPQNIQTVLQDVGLVILGGSGQFDISKQEEHVLTALNKVKPLIEYILVNDIPTLAICFGFQLVAYVAGASVEAKPQNSENGSVEVFLTKEGKEDKIFSNFPDSFFINAGHKDSVHNLPSTFTVLATNDTCQNQAYRHKNNVYGIQNHPELTKEDVLHRYSLYPEYMKGKNIDEMAKLITPTPQASKIFKYFEQVYLTN
ncbi:MAG: type 1 glutamine amidotransferase [Patescibacteria group bacterium]